MKLFKRTTITLLIVIALLWTVMVSMSAYPLNHIRLSENEINQTIMLLKKNNISISKEVLEENIKSVPTCEVEYLVGNHEQFAEKVFGSGFTKINETTFEKDAVKLKIKDNSITISGEDEDLDGTSIDNAASRALNLLESVNLSNTDMEAHSFENDGKYIVSFYPQYHGMKVYNCKITVTINDDNTYIIEGSPIVFGKSEGKILPKSTCAVLADLALTGNANGVEIKELNLGYHVKDNALTPVWEIKTDGNTFYAD